MDKTLTCRDCAIEFVFSVREQEFFTERGFTDPVRCLRCRRALKAQRHPGAQVSAPAVPVRTSAPPPAAPQQSRPAAPRRDSAPLGLPEREMQPRYQPEPALAGTSSTGKQGRRREQRDEDLEGRRPRRSGRPRIEDSAEDYE